MPADEMKRRLDKLGMERMARVVRLRKNGYSARDISTLARIELRLVNAVFAWGADAD